MSVAAESLYFDGISGAKSASSLLDQYGPHINAWPTGYKTIGFGDIKKAEPAAAYSIAAVGALLVRATGGDGSAASSLSSAVESGAVAATLQSSTMEAAINNIQYGGGMHATLAIATNLVDRNATASLKNALLSQSALQSSLGESVQDIVSRSASAGGLAQTAAKTGNELAIVDGPSLISKSEDALTGNLRQYFSGVSIPDKPMYRLVYAYTELARRGQKVAQYPSDPAAEAWFGPLVEAAKAIEASLPTGKSLESELSSLCNEMLRKAEILGIKGRLRVGGLGTAGSLSLSKKLRTATDAVQYRISKGIPAVANSTQTVNLEENPLSYSARLTQAQQSSLSLRLKEIFARNLAAYNECVERQGAADMEHRINRQRIEVGLYGTGEEPDIANMEAESSQQLSQMLRTARQRQKGLFGYKPHLRPERLLAAEQQNEVFSSFMQGEGPSPLEALQTLLLDFEFKKQDQSAWRSRVAAMVAAISAQNPSLEQSPAYRQALQTPGVREEIASFLQHNISMLTEFNLANLDESTLKAYGLRQVDMKVYGKLPEKLPPGEMPHNPDLAQPPLALMQLVADILNFNNQSVLPERKIVSRIKRTNEAQHSSFLHDQAVDSACQYAAERFGLPKPPKRDVAGLLLQCDLAHAMGLGDPETPYETRVQIAQRLQAVAAKVKARNLPHEAQHIISVAASISGQVG